MSATCTRARPLAGIALVVLLAAACGTAVPPASPAASPAASAAATASAQASPAAEPSPSATPEPTEEPTEEPSEEPSPSAADPTEALTIGPPYTIEPLDRVNAAALQAGMSEALGAFGDLVEIGARTVKEDGTDVAYVMGMGFPDMPIAEDPAFFSQFVQGMSGSLPDATVEEIDIGGTPVGLIESASASMAVYQDGTTFIMVIGTPGHDVMPVTEALIEANG